MKKAKVVLGALVGVLGLAQAIRPDRSNPPVNPAATFEALAKPPQQVAETLARSCADCHSHRTVWPWYSKVAPASWLVASDVKEGRGRLNLSQWNVYGPEMSRLRIRAMCQAVTEGEMPPKYYTPLHPKARLTEPDVAAICGMLGPS
jgi:hypothetical protein